MKNSLFAFRTQLSLAFVALLSAGFAATSYGAVYVSVFGSTVTVIGDNTDNFIEIFTAPDGRVGVSSNHLGGTDTDYFHGFFEVKNVIVATYEGNDRIRFDEATIAGYVKVNGGEGWDYTTFWDSHIYGDVTVDSGVGSPEYAQSIAFFDTKVNGDITAFPGHGQLAKEFYHYFHLVRSYVSGNVEVLNPEKSRLGLMGKRFHTFEDSYIHGDLTVKTGIADDIIEFHDDAIVRGFVWLDSSSGDDNISIDGSHIQTNMLIQTRAGHDVVSLTNSTFQGITWIATGYNNDSVYIGASRFDQFLLTQLDSGNDTFNMAVSQIGFPNNPAGGLIDGGANTDGLSGFYNQIYGNLTTQNFEYAF